MSHPIALGASVTIVRPDIETPKATAAPTAVVSAPIAIPGDGNAARQLLQRGQPTNLVLVPPALRPLSARVCGDAEIVRPCTDDDVPPTASDDGNRPRGDAPDRPHEATGQPTVIEAGQACGDAEVVRPCPPVTRVVRPPAKPPIDPHE